MNKFLTLLMVALLGISSIATAQDITKDDAFKQLMQAGVKQTKTPEKQSAAATYAMPTRTAQTAAKAATAEPVELYFDSFSTRYTNHLLRSRLGPNKNYQNTILQALQ